MRAGLCSGYGNAEPVHLGRFTSAWINQALTGMAVLQPQAPGKGHSTFQGCEKAKNDCEND
jgi:hypothetical protein